MSYGVRFQRGQGARLAFGPIWGGVGVLLSWGGLMCFCHRVFTMFCSQHSALCETPPLLDKNVLLMEAGKMPFSLIIS